MARNGWTETLPPGGHKIHNACGERRLVEGEDERMLNHEKVCGKLQVSNNLLDNNPKLVASLTPKSRQGENMANIEKPIQTAKATKTLMVEVKDSQGVIVGTLLATERTFATGSKGFGAYGKIGVKGSSQGYYQVGVNIVLVGSKPAGK